PAPGMPSASPVPLPRWHPAPAWHRSTRRAACRCCRPEGRPHRCWGSFRRSSSLSFLWFGVEKTFNPCPSARAGVARSTCRTLPQEGPGQKITEAPLAETVIFWLRYLAARGAAPLSLCSGVVPDGAVSGAYEGQMPGSRSSLGDAAVGPVQLLVRPAAQVVDVGFRQAELFHHRLRAFVLH